MNLGKTLISNYSSSYRLILGATMLVSSLAAQTTTPVTAPAVTAFNIERTLDLSTVQSSLTPVIPSTVQMAIANKALELRESVNFSPQDSLLTINLFAVQPGSPLPTPATTNLGAGLLSAASIKVDKVYIATVQGVNTTPATTTASTTTPTATPANSLMFVGTVAGNGPASPFGDLTGTPAAVAVGFTGDTPPKINNVVILFAGIEVDYAASDTGTLTFTSSPITPPGTSGNGIQIVIKTPASTVMNFITLDASSTSGGTAPLKFSWTVTNGTATIFGANNPIATAQLSTLGTYTFMVTVTDANGKTATQTVNVTYN